jgi:hypothetical protein
MNQARREDFTLSNTPYIMIRECCKCGMVLGTVPTTIPKFHMQITHTFCDFCLEEVIKQIDEITHA